MADEIGSPGSTRGQRKPLAGYLRLTVDRQGNKIGYEVQRRAIEAGATAVGETIGEWYQDKDLTAADLKVHRPDYERMLSDIEAGRWGGIAVWRLDRLVRLTREFERVNAILEDSKGYLLSIDPMMTTRDPMGKFMLRLVVMLAEMEIASMKARQIGHQREKARNGEYKGGGSRPFGFEGAVKAENGQVLNSGSVGVEHNPTEAALIREAARRLLNGESCTEIVTEWMSRNPPVHGPNGSLMTVTGLRKVLNSPRIAGLREYVERDPDTGEENTEYVTAQWKPVVERPDWERLRAMAVTRTRGRPYGYLLTGGLVVCAVCDQRMIGSRMQSQGRARRWYRCEAGPTAMHRGCCGRNAIRAEPIDDFVVAAVMRRIASTPEILDAVDRDIEDAPSEAVRTSMEIVADCDKKLEEYAGLAALPVARGGLTRKEWMALRSGVLAERESALRRLESNRSVRVVPTPMGRDRQDMRRWYDALSLEQQRLFLRAHVASVRIGKGRRGGAHTGAAQFDRISVLFADAQVFDAGSDQASVRDLDTDALLPTPLV